MDETTATLPPGWRDRLVPIENENTGGAIGWCIDPDDLAVSKLAAGREKDLEFVRALLRYQFASRETIRARLASTRFANEDAREFALARLGS